MNTQIIKFLLLISPLFIINACAFCKKKHKQTTTSSISKAGLRNQFPISIEDSIINEKMANRKHIRYYFHYKYGIDLSITQADSVANSNYILDTVDYNKIRKEHYTNSDKKK